jgi:ATP-dependent RNA helicase HelY
VATSASQSPAEAYAASRRRAKHPQLTRFSAESAFEFDDFQVRGCEALEEGHGVLVCAPTGAGKTVVGEFAVHLALAAGRKCFYTTPIKALSNQKYADLVDRYGADAVGLLTGDTSINGNAQVVVMTTEVLRNMLYAGSSAIPELGYVVMDEVHYLADRFRGAVWEEVILHLPEHVRVVGLSATVSNAEEFGEWLVEVRGDTAVVVDEHRPVPLWQHMLVGNQLLDLFAGQNEADPGEQLRINPGLLRKTDDMGRFAPAGFRGPRGARRGAPHRGPRFRPPSRVDVTERLDAAGLLPAIVFIFSRAGCDAAVAQCVRSGLRLNGPDQVEEIRRIVVARPAALPEGARGVRG